MFVKIGRVQKQKKTAGLGRVLGAGQLMFKPRGLRPAFKAAVRFVMFWQYGPWSKNKKTRRVRAGFECRSDQVQCADCPVLQVCWSL